MSLLITCCISSSLTMKFVADVSSSTRRSVEKASMLSITAAACEVLPLASAVVKQVVSFLLGRSLIKREISTFRTLRPSSARSFTAVSSVMTYSLPSPSM